MSFDAVYNSLFIVLIGLMILRTVIWTMPAGLVSRKERLWVECIFLGMCCLLSVFLAVASLKGKHPTLGVAFFGVATIANVRAFWRTYKQWRDTDDDDKPGKRRRAWIKAKLPKPLTKPVPVQQ